MCVVSLFNLFFFGDTLTSKSWNLPFIFDCHKHMQGNWIPVYWLTSQTTAIVKYSVLILKDLESSSTIGRLKLWTWRHPIRDVIRCKCAATSWRDQLNNNLLVDMSFHSDILFWIRANQSLLFHLNDVFLAEKQHITPQMRFKIGQYQRS